MTDKQPIVRADEEQIEYDGWWFCDPRRRVHRFSVLIFMCLLSFGSYFCYDNPAAMQNDMLQALRIDTETFAGFYSWYSWPNVFLCFVGGYLIDRVFGIRLGAIIFALFCFVGQLIFAAGAYANSIGVMNAGRFVFGIGGESLAVAQNTYAVSWFKGKELNLVFGLQLSFARVGSMINMNSMEPLYNWLSDQYRPQHSAFEVLGIALFLAALTCILSIMCALIMAFFDRRSKRILRLEPSAKTTTPAESNGTSTAEAKPDESSKVRLKDVLYFPAQMWLLCGICVFYYAAVFPLITLGQVFYEMKWDLDPAKANLVNSLISLVSIGGSPLFGSLVDLSGKNIFWVMLGITCTIVCHAGLAFTFITPFVSVALIGISYSILASALWPMVSLVIPEHQLGTAYGVMQAIQNLGLGLVNLMAGAITDSKGYLVLEVFFMASLFVALICAALLWVVDGTRGGYLNLTSRSRKALDQARSEQPAATNALLPGSVDEKPNKRYGSINDG